ncbi:MAG: hypothetical protein AAGA91_15060 [Pseudomonadota bacterium]
MSVAEQLESLREKQREISHASVSYWISFIAFFLFGLLRLGMTLLDPSYFNILIVLALFALAFISIRGLIQLRRVKRRFLENPTENLRIQVPKPVIYHAIFWWMPR